MLFLSLCLTACAQNPLAKSTKTERFLPSESLLVREPIEGFPAALTNAELLALARTWRNQAVQCNADKEAIWQESYGAPQPEKPSEPKPWWKFW